MTGPATANSAELPPQPVQPRAIEAQKPVETQPAKPVSVIDNKANPQAQKIAATIEQHTSAPPPQSAADIQNPEELMDALAGNAKSSEEELTKQTSPVANQDTPSSKTKQAFNHEDTENLNKKSSSQSPTSPEGTESQSSASNSDLPEVRQPEVPAEIQKWQNLVTDKQIPSDQLPQFEKDMNQYPKGSPERIAMENVLWKSIGHDIERFNREMQEHQSNYQLPPEMQKYVENELQVLLAKDTNLLTEEERARLRELQALAVGGSAYFTKKDPKSGNLNYYST